MPSFLRSWELPLFIRHFPSEKYICSFSCIPLPSGLPRGNSQITLCLGALFSGCWLVVPKQLCVTPWRGCRDGCSWQRLGAGNPRTRGERDPREQLLGKTIQHLSRHELQPEIIALQQAGGRMGAVAMPLMSGGYHRNFVGWDLRSSPWFCSCSEGAAELRSSP